MNTQDITSLAIGYCIVCTLIFLYGILTAHEDAVIMRNSGEPDYQGPFTFEKENVIIILWLLLSSFLPIVNIMVLVNTVLYRRGLL